MDKAAKFTKNLIFGKESFPSLMTLNEEQKLNFEVAMQIHQGMHKIRMEALKKFKEELIQNIKEKFPNYDTIELHLQNPININAPIIILYKPAWKIEKSKFKELIETEALNNHESPIILGYALEMLGGKMSYGIRKGSNRIDMDNQAFQQKTGLEGKKSEWWLFYKPFNYMQEFSLGKSHKTTSISPDNLNRLIKHGGEMIENYIKELADFIQQTENPVSEYVKEFKKAQGID